jgi:hypothetical protein
MLRTNYKLIKSSAVLVGNGQLHAPAASFPGTETPLHI